MSWGKCPGGKCPRGNVLGGKYPGEVSGGGRKHRPHITALKELEQLSTLAGLLIM